MSEQDDEEEQSIIKYANIYGGITQESKFWDDFEDIGEAELLKLKLVNIKIYTGVFNDKVAIAGISTTFKNIFTGKTLTQNDHKGSEDFVDVKEFTIKGDEFLTDFHIRFTNDADYISQIGYGTNKKNQILVPEKSDDGEDKTIEQNGGNNVIIGTFGCCNKRLDAMGFLYISKKEYTKRLLNGFFILRHMVKKDNKFKEKWEKDYKNLPIEFQYLWRVVNLPDNPYSVIIKYCYI